MSYMALYRKWRPDRFDEVKGQEHIVTTLQNQIKHDRIGHAYLFCGTRGTGKTTIAKLMAKAVNCEHPIDGSPCNECASCKAIAENSSLNVVEIDAASNNGVDNIRQINNSVQYSPSTGKYLVYIIDEVHMLSSGAFNALLKTLEEPPSYVIFILATTEYHKIPVTILSRCQRYDFRRISIDTITDRLMELLDREGVPAKRDAIEYIARAGDGSMRDSLSILDQCISFNLGNELTYDRVLDTIGAVDVEVYIELFKAITTQDVNSAMKIVDETIMAGKDIRQFVNEFTGFIRNVLMLKLDPNLKVDMTSENIARVSELGKNLTDSYLIEYINILNNASEKLSRTTSKRVVFEVAIIKLCKPQMQDGYEAMEKRIEELEVKLDSLGDVAGQMQNIVPAQLLGQSQNYMTMQQTGQQQNNMAMQQTGQLQEQQNSMQGDLVKAYSQLTPEQQSELSNQIVNNIRTTYPEPTATELLMIADLYQSYLSTVIRLEANFLSKAYLVPADEPGTLNLCVVKCEENKTVINYFERREHIDNLEKDMREKMGRELKINFMTVTAAQKEEKKLGGYDLSAIKNFHVDIVPK